jgi:hypothetical protein
LASPNTKVVSPKRRSREGGSAKADGSFKIAKVRTLFVKPLLHGAQILLRQFELEPCDLANRSHLAHTLRPTIERAAFS